MLDILRLFPRRPLAESLAHWLIFFTFQLVYLTIAASERYVPPADPPAYDQMWFIYTELPQTLPMAAAYAVCGVFLLQMILWFAARDNPDNLTIRQLMELVRKNPLRFSFWVIPRLAFLLGSVGLILRYGFEIAPWIGNYAALLLGFSLPALLLTPWVGWLVNQAVTAEESAKQGPADSNRRG